MCLRSFAKAGAGMRSGWNSAANIGESCPMSALVRTSKTCSKKHMPKVSHHVNLIRANITTVYSPHIQCMHLTFSKQQVHTYCKCSDTASNLDGSLMVWLLHAHDQYLTHPRRIRTWQLVFTPLAVTTEMAVNVCILTISSGIHNN